MKILCPICKHELLKNEKTYSCINKHCFDISKYGYLNIDIKNSTSGDNKEMVNSRTSFLNQNYYLPLKTELNNIIKNLNKNTILDLACGEGYYTKDFPVKQKFAIDLSKEAIKHASKSDKSTQYIISSIYNLPFEDSTFDLITTIFAPISFDEINRVLKNDGYFILVSPNKNHLIELKNVLYDTPYLNQDTTIEQFNLLSTNNIDYTFTVDNTMLKNLFKMTPYYYKTSKKDADKLNNINTLTISASFNISVYSKILPIQV